MMQSTKGFDQQLVIERSKIGLERCDMRVIAIVAVKCYI